MLGEFRIWKQKCPSIRKPFTDKVFETKMETNQKEAWKASKEVVQKFLRNYKDPNFKCIVENMLMK